MTVWHAAGVSKKFTRSLTFRVQPIDLAYSGALEARGLLLALLNSFSLLTWTCA